MLYLSEEQKRKLKNTAETTYGILKASRKKGIEVVYKTYGRKLYGYGIKNWNLSEDEAWDLVYKTVYRTAETSGNYEFEGEKKFASFIFKIFMNYLRNHYRDKKKRKEHIKFVNVDNATVEASAQTQLNSTEKEMKIKIAAMSTNEQEGAKPESGLMLLLKDELEKLEEWQKILLLLRCQNIPYREIAKYVDKPAGQLKTYYLRLKDKLAQRINEQMPATNNYAYGK